MRFAMIVWTVCAIMLGAVPGHAEKRVALVIGNSAYRHIAPLANPKNDAEDVAAKLREIGFETIVATDLDRVGFNTALARFSRIVTGAEIALVYYSGHGMQFGGTNYLLPVDATLDGADDVNRFLLTPVDDLLETLKLASGARVLVLDACRNNPVEVEMKRRLAAASGANRDAVLTRGLKPPSAGNGLLVAYATQANDVANDGVGRNSPFTAAFLKNVDTPDIDLRTMLFRVQDDVDRMTDHRQRPELSISLIGEFRLKVVARPDSVVIPPPADPAALAWTAVQNATGITDFEAFVRRYPDSFYADLARNRIDDLKKGQTAAVVPPVAPVRPMPALGPCGGNTLVSLASRAAGPLSAGEECALTPKTVFRECAQCPEMVVVPAGSFTMGSPAGEEGHVNDEGPQHGVTFDRQFAVGRFAVTFDEWDACASDDGACGGYRPDDRSWGRGRQPVINVSWNDVKRYLDWLSRKTGKQYRLPSEAEREYVTRAATTTPFWWGAASLADRANYDRGYTYGNGTKGKYLVRTVPVDSFQPNPWGLFQVHGNVWDWTEDCWNEDISDRADGTARKFGDCKYHVLRGGSWVDLPQQLRAANRDRELATSRGGNIGFRVAQTLTP